MARMTAAGQGHGQDAVYPSLIGRMSNSLGSILPSVIQGVTSKDIHLGPTPHPSVQTSIQASVHAPAHSETLSHPSEISSQTVQQTGIGIGVGVGIGKAGMIPHPHLSQNASGAERLLDR